MTNDQEQMNFLDQTWQTVRPLIGKELLAESGLVPVPNLSQADHFGLFSVFVKSKSENLGQKIKNSLGGSSYHVIGHVSQVIQLEKTDLDRLLDSAKTHSEDIDQSKKWEGDVDCGSKSVHMTVAKLDKFLISLSLREGDLYLKTNIPELVGSKSVYIITDVIKSSDFTATVTSDDDTMQRINVEGIPIGFGYSKFRLTPEGIVAEQIKCKPHFNGRWDVVVDQNAQYLNDL